MVRGAHGTYDRMDVPTVGRARGVTKSGAPFGLGLGGAGVGMGMLESMGTLVRTGARSVQSDVEAELEEAGVLLVDVEDVEGLFGE